MTGKAEQCHAVSLGLEPVSWKIKVPCSFVVFNKPVLTKLMPSQSSVGVLPPVGGGEPSTDTKGSSLLLLDADAQSSISAYCIPWIQPQGFHGTWLKHQDGGLVSTLPQPQPQPDPDQAFPLLAWLGLSRRWSQVQANTRNYKGNVAW